MISAETLEMIYKLTLAAILGMTIGLEREHRGKPAGLRTYALVALGAALFTLMSQQSFSEKAFDPSRIASQVVVGIGFLGAGLIFLKGDQVQGLTTAAGLWVAAAIGMAVGFGFYAVAIYATILALIILWVLRGLEGRIPKNPHVK